jgi:AcrR family transcriptional regulator
MANARTKATGDRSRRAQILHEAAKMFAARGFHGVGIDDIGAAAGISGPAIYRHFASKEALLSEMLAGISQRLLAGGRALAARAREPVAPIIVGGGSGGSGANLAEPIDVLHELIDFQVAFALDEPELIVVHDRDLASLPAHDRHEVRRLQREYVEIWVDMLRRVRPSAQEARARSAVHAVFGLINSTPHSARLPERAAMAALLHDMAVAALLAPFPPCGKTSP